MTATTTLRKRAELAEFSNVLNIETFTAERTNYRDQISDLYRRLNAAQMLIAQVDDVLNTSVVEVIEPTSNKRHSVTLRAIVEDFEKKLHRTLCPSCGNVECGHGDDPADQPCMFARGRR